MAACCSRPPSGRIRRARWCQTSRSLRFQQRALGKGRLAVSKEERPDPYDTVQDIQNIMSHRQDVLRLYNGPSMNLLYKHPRKGGRDVVQLLNYSRRPGGGGALFTWVKEPYRTARFVSPEMASPVDLKWVSPGELAGRSCPCRDFRVWRGGTWRSRKAKETIMNHEMSRREWLAGAGGAAGYLLTRLRGPWPPFHPPGR